MALLDITPVELERRVGASLETGADDGLGPWSAIALELPSGRQVELVRYDLSPEPRGFELRADYADDRVAALAETLTAMAIAPACVQWSPDPAPPAAG